MDKFPVFKRDDVFAESEEDPEYSYRNECGEVSDEDDLKSYLDNKTGDLETVKIYFIQVRDYPLLNREEEIECARLASEGDRKARDRLIEGNMRFVIRKALQYAGSGIDLGDLIQEGNIGLIMAADRFDYRQGTRFTTYAAYWVRQYLELAVSGGGKSVSVPHKAVSKFRSAIRRVYHDKPDMMGYPSAETIAAEMNTSVFNVECIIRALREPVFLDAEKSLDEESRLSDIIEDPDPADYMAELYRADRKTILKQCFSHLSLRERIAMELLAGTADGIEHSTEEIGSEWHVTRERVRQIAEEARVKIFSEVRIGDIQGYVDPVHRGKGEKK